MSEPVQAPAATTAAPVLGSEAPPPAAGLGVQPPAAPAPAATAAEVKPAEKTPEKTPEQVAAEKKAADEKAAADTKTAADQKAADDKAAFEKSWADWKPKLPDGAGLDEATLKEFTPLAKELGLKPEQAQKLVDLQVKSDVARAKAMAEGLKAEREGWVKALTTDKELGGAKWDASMRVANRAFERFANPELKAFLKNTGLDAHPGLFRAFHQIGLALKDDSIAGAALGGVGQPDAESIFRGWYPSMHKS